MFQVYNAFKKKEVKPLPSSELFAKELTEKLPNCKLSDLVDAILLFQEFLIDERKIEFKKSQLFIYLQSVKKYEK